MILLMLALGCAGHRQQPRHPDQDAVTEIEAFRQRRLPIALQGRFGLKVATPGVNGATTGLLVLARPDRMRAEIYTPLRTPMYSLASDGSGLQLYAHDARVFYEGVDAVGVLTEALGGRVGVDDVVGVLTGGLPLAQAPLAQGSWTDRDHALAIIEGPQGVRVRGLLDVRKGHLDELQVMDAGGGSLLEVRYAEHTKVRRVVLPESVQVAVPPLSWKLDFSFHTWEELGVIPDAFQMSVPAGAEQVDLLQLMQQAQQDAHH